jgi:sulfate adenylyltransferase subunit 2
MSEAQELAARVRKLSSKTGVSPTTLSRKLFGNGKRLEEIESGGSLTMTTYSRALAELAALEAAA